MTPTPLSIERLERVFADAMMSETFERLGSRRGIWDVSRDCDDPVPVVLHSRQTEKIDFRKGASNPVRPGIEITLLTACRKCRVCMAKRTKLWTWRAREELTVAPRTWFGTYTVEPAKHYWIDELAATKTGNFWKLPEAKKFELRTRVLGREATLYLKRIRKELGGQFRYLLVSEMHDSVNTDPIMIGRPHLHMCLPEVHGQPTFRKRDLQKQWPLGFSNLKITETGAEWYIAKYLAKALDARVRASKEYGNPPVRR